MRKIKQKQVDSLETAISGKVDKDGTKVLTDNNLTNTLKSNYDNAYTHSQSTHAPTNAQKNSDILKSEIEAKFTGEISSHTHASEHSHSNKTFLDTVTGLKTVNGNSVVGSGDIAISAGGESFKLGANLTAGKVVRLSSGKVYEKKLQHILNYISENTVDTTCGTPNNSEVKSISEDYIATIDSSYIYVKNVKSNSTPATVEKPAVLGYSYTTIIKDVSDNIFYLCGANTSTYYTYVFKYSFNPATNTITYIGSQALYTGEIVTQYDTAWAYSSSENMLVGFCVAWESSAYRMFVFTFPSNMGTANYYNKGQTSASPFYKRATQILYEKATDTFALVNFVDSSSQYAWYQRFKISGTTVTFLDGTGVALSDANNNFKAVAQYSKPVAIGDTITIASATYDESGWTLLRMKLINGSINIFSKKIANGTIPNYNGSYSVAISIKDVIYAIIYSYNNGTKIYKYNTPTDFTTIETLSAEGDNQVCYFVQIDDSNVILWRNYNKTRILNTTDNFLGVLSESGSLNEYKKVSMINQAYTTTGLTEGAKYYLQSNGTLGTTKTDVFIGVAISTTKLLITEAKYV